MLIKDKVCIVTGAASGIGEAVARAYVAGGARGVVVADLRSSRERLARRGSGAISKTEVTAIATSFISATMPVIETTSARNL